MWKFVCLEKPLCTKGDKDDFWWVSRKLLGTSLFNFLMFVTGSRYLRWLSFLKRENSQNSAPRISEKSLRLIEIQRISLLCDSTFFTHVSFIWLCLEHRNLGCPASQYASGSRDGFSAPYPRIFCNVMLVVTISSAWWGLCTPIYFRTCI